MYVDEVILRDFRAITASRVALTNPLAPNPTAHDLPNVNLLIGLNGSGKSSVLKAIAATITGSRHATFREMVSSWPRVGGPGDAEVTLLVRSGSDHGVEARTLRLTVGGDSGVTVTPRTRALFDGSVFAAYGPRRTPTSQPRIAPWNRPHLLFDHAPLAALPSWLQHASARPQAVEMLNTLLPDDVRCRPEPDRSGNWFEQRGIALPLGALSDGIQSFLAWCGDLLARLGDTGSTDLQDVPGVVLIDEVDQHLHPEWQRSIIGRLAITFPALQFVCTAQSPLIVSSLRIGNLNLVEPDPDGGFGATTVRRFSVEDVYGLTADQVLRSSYFGMESSRPAALVDELRSLANAAARGTDSGEAALNFMRRVTDVQRRARGNP